MATRPAATPTPPAGPAPKASAAGGRAAATAADRRSAKRIEVRGLLCDRGQLIDLSARGMRLMVHRRWPEGASRTITIVDTPHSIPVTARCVWCRQQSLFSHVVGLAFENLTQDQVEALMRMAQRHDQGDTRCDRSVEPSR